MASVEKMLVEMSNTTSVGLQFLPAKNQWVVAWPMGTFFGTTLKEAVRAVFDDFKGRAQCP